MAAITVRSASGDLIEIGDSSILFEEHDLPDRTNAFHHHKQPGERDRSTLA